MLAKILFAATFILGALAAVISMQPAHYRVARSITIQAPPSAVFEMVNDFHRWPRWSPWEKLDPQMKRTFSGAESGAGAMYAWAGNGDVGEGRMTLQESRPDEKIGIRLEFLEPFESSSQTLFQFRPVDSGTGVTWEMNGENGFVQKAFCMVMDMDKMVGGDFEKGLAQLKSVVEAGKH